MTAFSCVRFVPLILFVLSTNRTDAQTRQASAATTVTVEGCVQSAEVAAPVGGSSPAAPANVDAAGERPVYLLTEARPTGGRSDRPTPGTRIGTGSAARTRNADGTVTTASDAGTPAIYGLIGNARELGVHAGHRVEVTGTLVPAVTAAATESAPAAPPPAASAPTALGAGPAPDTANAAAAAPATPARPPSVPSIRVTTITTVAAACSR